MCTRKSGVFDGSVQKTGQFSQFKTVGLNITTLTFINNTPLVHACTFTLFRVLTSDKVAEVSVRQYVFFVRFLNCNSTLLIMNDVEHHIEVERYCVTLNFYCLGVQMSLLWSQRMQSLLVFFCFLNLHMDMV